MSDTVSPEPPIWAILGWLLVTGWAVLLAFALLGVASSAFTILLPWALVALGSAIALAIRRTPRVAAISAALALLSLAASGGLAIAAAVGDGGDPSLLVPGVVGSAAAAAWSYSAFRHRRSN